MPYYPMALNIQEWPCLVVGGGRIALSRALRLADAGASVTVVSPSFVRGFSARANIDRIPRTYEERDLEGMFVVIAATNDPDTNGTIAHRCKESRILCNVVDDPESSTFLVPAATHRGALSISVSTDGASPALAARLRQHFDEWLPEDMEAYVAFLGEAREKTKAAITDPDTRRKVANYFASVDGYARFKKLNEKNRARWIKKVLSDPKSSV